MKTKTTLVSALLFFSGSMAHIVIADSGYQFDTVGAYSETRSNAESDSRLYGGGILAYLKPVDTGSYPYAESSFFARESFIGVVAFRANIEQSTESLDGNIYSAFAGYRGKKQPFFVDALYTRGDLGGELNGADIRFLSTVKSLSLGLYFDKYTAAKITYSKTKLDLSGLTTAEDTSQNGYQFDFKKIMSVSDSDFLNVEMTVFYEKDSKSDTKKGIEGIADYYFDKTFNLGASFAMSKSDFFEGKLFGFRVGKFITPYIGLTLAFRQFLSDDNGVDFQQIETTLNARF